jgi:TRAP-type C4-dicarboxylate transport system permease small subunit
MKTKTQILYNRLDQMSGKFAKALEVVVALFIFLSLLTLLFQVLYRFVILKFVAFSFPFTEEFARYLLIWSVYFIIGVNFRDGSMVTINFIYDRLEGNAKTGLYYVTRILMLVFIAVVFFYSLRIIQQNIGFRSATLRVPGWVLYLAPSIGLVLICLETIIEIFGVMSGIVKPFGLRREETAKLTDEEVLP